MNKSRLYESLVYPGDYMPVHNIQEIMEELKQPHEGETVLPPLNLTEYPDFFRIEMAVPGLKHEDFLVETDDNILSVSVLHKEQVIQRNFQVHEYNYECFKRYISLPLTAETAFAIAEYKNGLLSLLVPKGEKPLRETHVRVVVY